MARDRRRNRKPKPDALPWKDTLHWRWQLHFAVKFAFVNRHLSQLEAALDKLTAHAATPTTSPDLPPATMSVEEFCTRNGLGRSTFYAQCRKGLGPATIRVGKAVRVTVEAEAAWQARMSASRQPPSDGGAPPPAQAPVA